MLNIGNVLDVVNAIDLQNNDNAVNYLNNLIHTCESVIDDNGDMSSIDFFELDKLGFVKRVILDNGNEYQTNIAICRVLRKHDEDYVIQNDNVYIYDENDLSYHRTKIRITGTQTGFLYGLLGY